MQCPKCQFENPDNAKFCIECASPMEFHCPNCGAIKPATGKFCRECAYDLRKPKTILPKDPSFDEKLTKIQKYLPEDLTEKILSQRDRIESERKQVTAIFCDIKGFTPLSELLGMRPQLINFVDVFWESEINRIRYKFAYAISSEVVNGNVITWRYPYEGSY